ncbi:MAG: HEPN domain-containing protein [Candidatus Micrarchaeales archaeon]
MDSDEKEWLDIAADNLVTARILYDNERLRDAAYYCQQVAEKSLKAVQVRKLKRFDKVHDLQELAESVGAPTQVKKNSKVLTKYYISARYPIREEGSITENDVSMAISQAEEVLEWARLTLR